MKKKDYLLILLFALLLILFAVFSKIVGFHDSFEYINVAKNLAGIKNVPIFSTHPIIYPLITSLFLKIWPSLTMIKIINVLWVFLIGLVLFLVCKDRKAFILFAFSPLVWYTSIQTTPVLPAALFFLLAYFFYNNEYKYSKVMSGFCLGLGVAFYTPMLLVAAIFVLVYFWNSKLSDVIKFSIAIVIGIIPELVIDYLVFGNPFYSFIRYAGTNALVLLGINPNIGSVQVTQHLEVFLIFIVISPLLFRLHRLEFKKYKKDVIFLATIFLIFFIRAGMLKYFLIISPVVILLLAKVLTDKEIKWHCLIAIPIILLLTMGYFTYAYETNLKKDLSSITEEYNPQIVIAGGYEASGLAAFSWKNAPRIEWFEDYNASLENRSVLRQYTFKFEPRNIQLNNILEFSAKFLPPNETYGKNTLLISADNNLTLQGFSKKECYKILCVYTNNAN